MTFSSEVKDELIRVTPDVRHCKLAEILAIVYFIVGGTTLSFIENVGIFKDSL